MKQPLQRGPLLVADLGVGGEFPSQMGWFSLYTVYPAYLKRIQCVFCAYQMRIRQSDKIRTKYAQNTHRIHLYRKRSVSDTLDTDVYIFEYIEDTSEYTCILVFFHNTRAIHMDTRPDRIRCIPPVSTRRNHALSLLLRLLGKPPHAEAVQRTV